MSWGHDYRDERIYGPRGPYDAWDQRESDGKTYFQQREESSWHFGSDYQSRFMQRGPDGYLINGRGW